MLTKKDLQQIREVVKEEAYGAIQGETPKIVRPIVQDEIHIALKPIKRKLNKLHKDFHVFIVHFDGRFTKVEHEMKGLQQN